MEGEDLVTLVTCTPYGVNTHRLLVRGERTVYKQSESKIEDMIKKNNLKYIMLTAGVILALIGMTVLVSVFLIKRRKRRKLNENKRINLIAYSMFMSDIFYNFFRLRVCGRGERQFEYYTNL